MTAVSRAKVSAETDRLFTDAAYFLGRSQRVLVDAAACDYVEAHRDEINAGVRAALSRLDGSNAAIVAEISGLSREDLDEVGGVPER